MLSKSNEFATWVHAIYRSLVLDGYDADSIMEKADFDFSALTSTTQEVPKKDIARIWDVVEAETGDDAYCLRILPHVSDPYVNALVTSTQSCGSMQEALDILLKYYRIVHSGVDIRAGIDSGLTLTIESNFEDFPLRRQDIDVAFCLIAKYGSALPSKDIQPIEIHLKRSIPDNIQAYDTYFNCPIVFGSDKDLIRFPLSILSEEIPTANPGLSNHVEQYLADQMLGLDKSNIAESVQREIIHLLPDGTPKLQDVAQRLNVSARTLQRKLQEIDANFSTLLNETRLDLAKKYLKESRKSVQEIAQQLGFTESGNFIRFFKQQTGKTPSNFCDSVHTQISVA